MQLLILAFVLLSTTIYLPIVNGYGPRTVIPTVAEANTTSSVSMDPQAPSACFDELSPAAVVAAGAQAAICPIPGKRYPVLSGGGHIALVGNDGTGRRAAWGGSNPYTLHNPDEVITGVMAVEFDESVTGMNREPGPIITSGPYRLLVLPSFTGDDVSAAEVQATSFEKMDFAGHLYDLIKNETGGIVIDMLRGGVWYNRNDTTGQDFTTAAARGCGSGDTIQWVAVGPVRTVVVAPGQNLILFRGAFNQPGDIACMGDYKDIEVARIMATPAVVRQVEDYKGRQGNAKWNWNIGDGLARTFAWSGWDYLSFFAVRSSGSGVPTTTSMFFFVPEDFMDVTCVIVQGRKSCLITQTEPGF